MIFRHHKGGLYRLLFHASDSTNARTKAERPADLVVYVSLSTGKILVRDRVEFYGTVDTPDGQRARFSEVEPR